MTKEDIMKPENLVYQKPRLLNDNPMHYCPGCSHGVVHKLIAEVIDEMNMSEKAIGISPVGCAVFMYNYLDRTCSGTGISHQTFVARPTGVHLSGRRRFGMYRYGRNHPRIKPWRKHHHHFH